MPDFNAYWGSRGGASLPSSGPGRAVDIARIIDDAPTAIALRRGATTLAAQTVHVTRVSGERAVNVTGAAGTSGTSELLLVGTQDHPDRADFDVQRGDRFALNGSNWMVRYVARHAPGLIEAYCEGVQ